MAEEATLSIDEFLLGAGLASVQEITAARRVSQSNGRGTAAILVENGKLSQRFFQAASLACSLVAYRLLDIATAYKAAHLMSSNNLTFEASLKILGWRAQDYSAYESFLKLGQLLLACDCATKEQISAALEACVGAGKPLLPALINRQALSANVGYAAISAYVLLEKRAITKHEAQAVINRARRAGGANHVQIRREDLLSCAEVEGIRLGDLLNSSGAISDLDLISTLEQCSFQNRLLGEVLLENQIVSEKLLKAALLVQEQSKMGVITIQGAIEATKKLASPKVPGNSSRAKDGAEKSATLLNLSGLANVEDAEPVISELLLQRKNLAFKLVNQFEEITNSIARDLHDTVLADLLAVHRNLAKSTAKEASENLDLLENVIRQLRELCGEYSPRNLSDWGLSVVLEDLLDRFEQRTAIEASFIWNANEISLPEQVELQIFRIVQECLNNVAKHARATAVVVKVERTDHQFKIVVKDNGRGLPVSPQRKTTSLESGGMGSQNIDERMELIRCHLPASLKVESAQNKGVKVSLEISLP